MSVLRAAGLIVATASGRSRVAEEISVVQHQVLRNLDAPKLADRRGRIILVTSARPGEGKSFTALNVAGSMAASGARPVLLVDADAKRGSLSDLLGRGDAPGLRALAAEPGTRPEDVILPTELPHLQVVPYGQHASKEARTLPPGAALGAAILRLADAQPGSAIVVDATPCLSTSDPGTFASIAGQVLLVVEAEQTQRNEVEAALDMVEACPLLQLVLNKARLTMNDTFGAYYG